MQDSLDGTPVPVSLTEIESQIMYSPPDRSICPLACFVKFSANSSQSLTSSDETGIDVFYMRLRHFDATAKWTPSIWKARVKTLATIDDMHQWLTEMRAKRESDIIRMSFWPDDLSFMSECCSPKDNPPSKTKTPIPHKAYEYLCALNTTESVSVFFNTFGAGESLRKTERLKKDSCQNIIVLFTEIFITGSSAKQSDGHVLDHRF